MSSTTYFVSVICLLYDAMPTFPDAFCINIYRKSVDNLLFGQAVIPRSAIASRILAGSVTVPAW